MINLKEKIKNFPKGPGVYLFLDKKNKVLYVGRATSLKRRIADYFRFNLDSKIKELISLTKKIKFIKTDNLLEAVILEANLIKKYWPKYNIKERDNRSFLYIVINKSDYPKPIIVRQQELKKFKSDAFIFGPYFSLSLIKNALRLIRRIFPYSLCKPNQGKPCFDYQIGLCPGICIGKIKKEEYQNNIKNLILFLSGQKKKLFKKLAKENPDLLKGLKHIQDVALITKDELIDLAKLTRIEAYDISHLAGKEPYGSMVVFVNNKPDKSQYRIFKIKEAPKNDDLKALEEVIRRRFKHHEWQFPDLILIDGGRPQVNYLDKVLKSLKIGIPLVGLSKLANDKLIFPKKTKKNIKELTKLIYPHLLAIRDEAHRFALKFSRKKRSFLKNFSLKRD